MWNLVWHTQQLQQQAASSNSCSCSNRRPGVSAAPLAPTILLHTTTHPELCVVGGVQVGCCVIQGCGAGVSAQREADAAGAAAARCAPLRGRLRRGRMHQWMGICKHVCV